MKLGLIWIFGISLTILIACHYSVSTRIGDQAHVKPVQVDDVTLDLKRPVEKILHRLQRLQKSLNVDKLLESIIWIVMNCVLGGGGSQQNAVTFQRQQKVEADIRNFVAEYRPQIDEFLQMGFNDTCQTPLFYKLHTYIWVDDQYQSVYNLVKFYWTYGDKLVFLYLKLLLLLNECPTELEQQIPSDPIDYLKASRGSSVIENTNLSSPKNPFQLPDFKLNCEILDLFAHIQGTGLLDIILLVDTLIHEVIQDPAIHFFAGKIQEPAKGKSFHGFWLVPELRQIIFNLDKLIRSFIADTGLNELLKDLIGVSICKVNILETLLVLIESLVWNVHEPVPPGPDPPNVCFN